MEYQFSQNTKKLNSLLSITYPIIQAPVGGIATPELASSVSNTGSLGGLALSWSDPESAQKTIEAVKAKTDNPFFVNFALNFEPIALFKSLELGVKIIQFSWGLPNKNMIDTIKSNNGIMGIQVTGEASALKAIAIGADYLVCQGLEAGGHVHATRSLDMALEEVLRVAKDIPVIASGGIATGEDIHKYLTKGAAGVVMGSRFVATKESGAHPDYKKALVISKLNDTVLTVCMNKGWDNSIHRILRNSTFNNWETHGCPKVGNRPGEYDILGTNSLDKKIERYSFSAPVNGVSGNIEAMTQYAGKSIQNINDIPSVSELIERILKDFLTLMS
tara:strand:- start:41392 stop:42387 length:996 start_codon:yes stop_codon:yes gene_type:complete